MRARADWSPLLQRSDAGIGDQGHMQREGSLRPDLGKDGEAGIRYLRLVDGEAAELLELRVRNVGTPEVQLFQIGHGRTPFSPRSVVSHHSFP